MHFYVTMEQASSQRHPTETRNFPNIILAVHLRHDVTPTLLAFTKNDKDLWKGPLTHQLTLPHLELLM